MTIRVQNVSEPDVHVQDSQYDIGEEQIERIFECFPLEVKDRKVLVKPNLLGLFTPDKAVTTHPSLVRSVVQCLKRRGACVTVGDNPGLRGYGDNERIARFTGIHDAVEDCYQNIAKRSTQVTLKNRRNDSVLVSTAVLESDLIVSLPKLKTHMLTQITCGIKNTFGYLVGGEKTKLHSLSHAGRDFCETIVDVFSIRPPDLTIVDAVVAMQGSGPSAGDPREIGKLYAGRDAVLVDLFTAGLIGVPPERLHQLHIAKERGLLSKTVEALKIEGSWKPVQNFAMPSTFKSAVGHRFFSTLGSLIRWGTKLEADHDKCIKCGLCAKQCPVEAIKMNPYPEFGKGCITCYCCHEICPHGAIHESGLMRYPRKLWAKT